MENFNGTIGKNKENDFWQNFGKNDLKLKKGLTLNDLTH
jgi:hypothetical protein